MTTPESARLGQFWEHLGHLHCKVFQDGRYGPFLFVGEKDDSHSHVILNHFYSRTRLYVSPDLRHILALDDNVLTHHYLGLRPAPERTFRIDLSNRELLNAERRADFQRYLKKRVPFWGRVYAPLTNPLNGKLIGPDPKQLKGFVRVSEWHDTYATVTTATELVPFGVNDIVTDIASEQWGEFGNWAFNYKGEWRALQASISGAADPQPSAQVDPTSAAASNETMKRTADSSAIHPSNVSPAPSRTGEDEAADVERAHADINKVYKQLMGELDPDRQKRLREAQRAWIKWRDAEAGRIANAGGAVGGSAYRVDYSIALAKLVRERTEVLKGYLKNPPEIP